MSTELIRPYPPPGYHSISGDGFTLRVNLNVFRTLDAVARADAKIRGLLLGSDASDARLDAVSIVTIEHQFGPLSQLSDSDIELFRRTISRLQQQSGPRIIGHFRSHTKGEA